MGLLTNVMLRIALIVALCVVGTSALVMRQAHQAIIADTNATAERVGQHLQQVYWNRLIWRDGMNRTSVIPFPEWETLATLDRIAPGLCVIFSAPTDEPRRLCSKVDKIAAPAPRWFAAVHHELFAAPLPVRWSLTNREQASGVLYASVMPDTAVRLAWAKVSIVMGVAALMAVAIALLASLVFSYALLPARAIVGCLRQLQAGAYGERLPIFRTIEFGHVARAVNQLAGRLDDAKRERATLTARLFKAQEDERRSIARDLHDEFGQCLSATTALAALIETKTAEAQPGIAEDARTIARTQQRMMTALRGTLSRLLSQNIEEIGLEASLRELVAERNVVSPGIFRLTFSGHLTGLPIDVAVGVYRIAQEGLTNAARHGKPQAVALNIERANGPPDLVTICVEDDGGGDVRQFPASAGHGLIGLRERIVALGGNLSLSGTGRGVRVFARIPVDNALPGAAT